jgi:hypothetical protein
MTLEQKMSRKETFAASEIAAAGLKKNIRKLLKKNESSLSQ